MKSVYCYQVGLEDCYKVGHTKNEPEKRKKGFSTGSPKKLTLYKAVESEFNIHVEKYAHSLLDPKRAENGEFFNVTSQELDAALDEAFKFVSESRPLVELANKLKKTRPSAEIKEASDKLKEVYRQLRNAAREKFLADRRFEMLKSKIQVAIGEDLGISGIASWKWRELWTFDVKNFEKKHPKLHAKFMRDSSSRHFELERVDLVENES